MQVLYNYDDQLTTAIWTVYPCKLQSSLKFDLDSVFPDQFKACSVPLLKKCNLDKEDLSNCRPISYLSFLSKLTKRMVKNHLTQHLSSNNLHKFQSTYTKLHLTKCTFLAVNDHIIKAMFQQQVTALSLGSRVGFLPEKTCLCHTWGLSRFKLVHRHV